jgi:hypothetical protein
MHRDPSARFATASDLAARLDEARRQLETDGDDLRVPPPPPVPGRAGVLGAVAPRTSASEPWAPPSAATARDRNDRRVHGHQSQPRGATERSGTRPFGPAPPRPADRSISARGVDRRLFLVAALLALLVPVGVAGWLLRGGDGAGLALADRPGVDGEVLDEPDTGGDEPDAGEGEPEAGPDEHDAGDDEPDAGVGEPAAAGDEAGADVASGDRAAARPCTDVDAPDPQDGDEVLQADIEGRGCTVPVIWDGQQLTIPLQTGETARYDLAAEPDDLLLLGDWSCDGRAAPALYRPADGQLFLFDEFSEDATARGEPSGVLDGLPVVVTDPDGCAHVEIQPSP